MRQEIIEKLDRVNSLTKKGLHSVTFLKRVEKLEMAKDGTHGGSNNKVVQRAIDRIYNHLNQMSLSISRDVHSFDRSIKSFEDLLNRLFISLTAIRVEANAFDDQLENRSSLNSLIDSLEQLISQLSEKYEKLRESSLNIRYATQSKSLTKESYEKTSAA